MQLLLSNILLLLMMDNPEMFMKNSWQQPRSNILVRVIINLAVFIIIFS